MDFIFYISAETDIVGFQQMFNKRVNGWTNETKDSEI